MMANDGPAAAKQAAIAFEKKYTPDDFLRFGTILKLEETEREQAFKNMSESDRALYLKYVEEAYEVDQIFRRTFIRDVKTDNSPTVNFRYSAQRQPSPESEGSHDDNREKLVHSDPVVRRDKFK
jgi:hypothetical protein